MSLTIAVYIYKTYASASPWVMHPKLLRQNLVPQCNRISFHTMNHASEWSKSLLKHLIITGSLAAFKTYFEPAHTLFVIFPHFNVLYWPTGNHGKDCNRSNATPDFLQILPCFMQVRKEQWATLGAFSVFGRTEGIDLSSAFSHTEEHSR